MLYVCITKVQVAAECCRKNQHYQELHVVSMHFCHQKVSLMIARLVYNNGF